MTLLIFAIIVVIVVCLAWVLTDLLASLVKAEQPPRTIIKVGIILIAILVICNRAGWV